MVAWRYGSSLLVFNSISQWFAALTREISRWTLGEKFHTSARPSIILCVSCNCIMRFRSLCVSVMMIMSIKVSFRHKNFIHCFLLARVLVVVCFVESLCDAYTECHEPHLSVPWVSTDNNDSNVIIFFWQRQQTVQAQAHLSRGLVLRFVLGRGSL